MDLATITEFIQNVGFPITCCAVLFYLLYQGMQQRQEEAQERAKRDAEFSRIIAENTAATNSPGSSSVHTAPSSRISRRKVPYCQRREVSSGV